VSPLPLSLFFGMGTRCLLSSLPMASDKEIFSHLTFSSSVWKSYPLPSTMLSNKELGNQSTFLIMGLGYLIYSLLMMFYHKGTFLVSTIKTNNLPTNHYKPLVINNLSNNLDNLFCFLFFFLFLLFFFSFFFKFTNFDTSNIYTITCCQVTLTIHHDTWHKMPPFLLNLNTTKLWLNIPLS